MSLEAVLVVLGAGGASLGQPVLHTGAVGQAGVRLTVLLVLHGALEGRRKVGQMGFISERFKDGYFLGVPFGCAVEGCVTVCLINNTETV